MKPLSRRAFLKVSGLLAAGLVLPQKLAAAGSPALKNNILVTPNDLTRLVQGPSLPQAPAAPTAYQLQTPHHALAMDLSSSDFTARVFQLYNQGYRPIWLQGASNGSSPATYSAVWVRDGGPGYFVWKDMDFNEYQTRFTDYANQGYRPISVSGYQNNGANQYAAIWMYAPGIGYAGVHDTDHAGYATWETNEYNAGLWPQLVDGYAVGSNPTASDHYIAINAPITAPGGTWDWIGMTSADYQTFFNTYASQGFHVISLSAYQINGATYFAAIWVKDSITDWAGRHDWLPGDLFNEAVNFAKADYQPTVIEPYDNGATRSFAGVWIKKARSWTATGAANPNLSPFDSAMQSFMQARNMTSGALAVTKDSRLVYARGYSWDGYTTDPVAPTSLFRIASLSKPLTSMAIMRLVQENTLHLTDHLTTLLALSLPAPLDGRMNNITLLHLLQHLGGWNRDTTFFDPMFADQTIASAMGSALPISQQTIINYMTTQRMLDFTPGTLYDYSNYGYLLLGRIIEAVTHLPYATYMQNAVFSPLGISRILQGASEFENRKPGEVAYYTADSGLYANMRQPGAPANAMLPYGNFNLENMDSHGGYLASAVDLARFATAFDSTGLYPVLSKATINQVFAVPAVGANPDGSWYGCGWAVRPAGSGLNTWHNGSLVGTSTLMVRRYDGLDWVALFNQRDDPSGLDYGAIDADLHTAANAVTTWPAGDLFPTYSLPSRFQRRIFIPLTRK